MGWCWYCNACDIQHCRGGDEKGRCRFDDNPVTHAPYEAALKRTKSMPLITATRYHDFSAGHRVVGHENKCASLHGHNYRVHFECAARELDTVGRVIDFGDIKTRLCDWLEDRWDHCFLLWEDDPLSRALQSAPCPAGTAMEDFDQWLDSFHTVPFNPTAENMARHLLTIVAPGQLKGTGIVCCSVLVEETRKCSASAVLTQREMDILLGVGK